MTCGGIRCPVTVIDVEKVSGEALMRGVRQSLRSTGMQGVLGPLKDFRTSVCLSLVLQKSFITFDSLVQFYRSNRLDTYNHTCSHSFSKVSNE